MPFQGLPGEEQVNRLCHQKRFRDTYGEGSDPKALYIAQPVWTRFSACFPRVAFLLDNLNWIYSVLDVTLVQFRNAYVLHGDAGPEGYRLVAPHIKNIDPFEYFSGYMNEDEQRSCLLHLRWALHRSRGSHFEFLFRECANDILDSAKIDDRKSIVEELMSSELAEVIGSIPIDMDKGIWAVRRQISWREAMIDDALKRVRSALDTPAVVSTPQRYYGPESLPSPTVNGFHDVEYGTDPIPTNGVREHTKRELRFSESPPGRSISPTWSRRGRRHGHRQRSISRDSYASTMHSIITEVPEEPDHFSLSMKVFSHATDEWHDIAAVMDTGCDAGNWISSRYLEEHLRMGGHIEEDPEADVIRVIDFGGKTDIKPRGRVKLLWYGKIVEEGRQAKRSVKSEDWFRVAPPLPTESGEQPFDILLGKDWILEHEVFTFRGLRLFKSKDKKRKGE